MANSNHPEPMQQYGLRDILHPIPYGNKYSSHVGAEISLEDQMQCIVLQHF
jgi:hypothetical protein